LKISGRFSTSRLFSLRNLNEAGVILLTKDRITTKRKTLGQVLICLGCCCGRTDRGHPPVPVDWLKAQWKLHKLHKSVQLTISGCLGPCDVANVVCIITPRSTIWLGGLTTEQEYEALLGWASRSTEAGALLPLPSQFEAHILDRFQTDEERLAICAD
jgi:cobaltochelatase CobN